MHRASVTAAKEKAPKEPTIREKFNTYRFADYKEKVADLPRHRACSAIERKG